MRYHVLPTLPDPPHDHEMPKHDTPDHRDVPPDIGTGQAGFLFACVVLAITLAMGILAISQLKSATSLTANTFERASAIHMEAPLTRTSGPAAGALR
ncbi:MAG: hypothetical protein Q8K93_13945 [Reyranella sp.]|uniref:hypothetical protein n=1 Tax=Reyranella sp. TaxID=1929291 RepID=UPI0027310253|nr:hypothetical protein [Reyranella sp.]MDP1963295.1 hypothetical protein [Reyranella sp.]MDP2373300.1 hypothetical protein [Reyranella sp.]